MDPKGEIIHKVGGLLKKKGYEVRVLDLLNMNRSHCYNPFVYLHDDNDVQRLVEFGRVSSEGPLEAGGGVSKKVVWALRA